MGTASERSAAAEVLAKARPRVERFRLLLDPELLHAHAALEAQLEQAEHVELRERLAEEIVDLERRIADEEIEFVFQGLGRGRWRKLAADHPPTDEQKAEGARDFDPDVFPLVAMAASIREPALTIDELEQLADEVLTEYQFQELWGTCLRANIGGGTTRPESLAAHAILANGRYKSAPPSDSESTEAS